MNRNNQARLVTDYPVPGTEGPAPMMCPHFRVAPILQID
jgi:hypothetical protein